MSNLWMAISPSPTATRVMAMAGAGETILKARLSPSPSHPRALPTLLEAIALWQGDKVRAALCAAGRQGASDSSLYRAAFDDFGGPLYSLDWVPAGRGRHRARDVGGMGRFADLRQHLFAEVTR